MDSFKVCEDSNSDFQIIVIVDFDDGRLFPLTEESPKCLLPIANRKLLAYQLDLLKKSGARDVIVTTPEEYYGQISSFFVSEYTTVDSLKIEIVPVVEMMGPADALRAVSDRIRGDFIVFNSDIISECTLGQLVHLHRLRTSDITMLLSAVLPEEPEKKGGKKKINIDEQDKEYIGLCSDGRIVMKTPALEFDNEEFININKSLINVANNFNLRNDLIDVGVYIMSYWVLEFLKNNTRISSLRTELLPYLVKRQYQPANVQYKDISALQHRNRPLQELESWLVSIKSVNYSSLLPVLREENVANQNSALLVGNVSNPSTAVNMMSSTSSSITQLSIQGNTGVNPSPKSLSSSPTQSNIMNYNTLPGNMSMLTNVREDSMLSDINSYQLQQQINNNIIFGVTPNSNMSDLLRIFALVVPTDINRPSVPDTTLASGTTSSPYDILCQKINSTQQYMNLNRDLPSHISNIGPKLSPWDPIQRYQKKELSVVGDACTIGDKVTIKQCSIGNNCRFGAKSKVNNCVIMNNVVIGENCVIQNCVICAGVTIENNCNLNECYVGANVSIAENSKIKSESLSSGMSSLTM